MASVAHAARPAIAALALTTIALALAGVIMSFRETRSPTAMLEVVRTPSLFGGYDSDTLKDLFDGRCRCTGHGADDHSKQRVVCACTDKDDLWRKGPWQIITGYTVVYDKHEENAHLNGKYLTVVAQGFPDGADADPHYYLLIQPWDDFGQPTMDDLYPDAALGVPEDGFLKFDTTDIHDAIAFKDQAVSNPQLYSNPFQVIGAYPELAPLFK